MSQSHHNLFAAFIKAVDQHQNRPAITTCQKDKTTQTISYKRLLEYSDQAAALLKEHNLKKGQRVVLCLENSWLFSTFFFALQSLSAVVVLVDSQYEAEHIHSIYNHCEAVLLITTEHKIVSSASLKDTPMQILLADAQDVIKALERISVTDRSMSSADHDSLAVIFYTSGTTQSPKGVMLSHRNLLSNVDSVLSAGMIDSSDKVLSFLPLHHAYAFTVTLLIPLYIGATIVYPSGISSMDLIHALKSNHVSIFVGVPQVFHLIHRSISDRFKHLSSGKKFIITLGAHIINAFPKSSQIRFKKRLFNQIHQNFGGSIKYLVSGGAKLSLDVAEDFESWGFKVLEGYGLTETSPIAAFNLPTNRKLGSVGQAIEGVNIKINNPNAQGRGEVLIKGPNLMQGYFNLPDQTSQVIQDGWFHTGDLGYIDQQGYLFLEGRLKEMIVLSSGKNIQPEEVEEHYGQNPFVKEIGVVAAEGEGMIKTDEQLMALIVPNEDHFKSVQETSIRGRLTWEFENLSAQLPTYKRIKGFKIVTEPLPRTRLGKLKRYELIDMFKKTGQEDTSTDEDNRSLKPSTDVQKAAVQFIEKTFNRKVSSKDHLELDLGLDSLGRIELLLNLQEHLNMELDDDQAMGFFNCNTVGELQAALDQLLPSQTDSVKDLKDTVESTGINWSDVLDQPPAPATLNKIKLVQGVIDILFNVILITFFKVLFKMLFLLSVNGKEKLPQKSGYLICSNHTSYLDALFILCALPYRVVMKTYFVGFSQFLESSALKPFVRTARLIPLEMSYNLIEALKASSYVLKHQKNVCYFPEGQRSIDGDLKEFKKGVGILAQETGVPVVPVYLKGAYKTWGRGQKWPKLAHVTVYIDQPVNFKQQSLQSDQRDKDELYISLATQVRLAVKTLKDRFDKKSTI